MGKLVFLFFFVFIIVGCSLKKESFEIHTTDDVLVFRTHEDGAFLQGDERINKSIATLKKGEKLKILDSYQGKDYLAYRIKTAGGIEGFVIHGDKFVVSKVSSGDN